MNRKEFIRITLAATGSLIMLPACVSRINAYRFFTNEEAQCVIALSERIIPADETWPGASWAGVVHYIDKQLIRVFTEDQPRYRAGLQALQGTSRQMHNQNFEDLNADLQDDLLHRLENSDVDADLWTGQSSADFFRMIINHTMQGYYGSPRHGGNRNYVSYRMLDLDYPLVVGQNRYRGNDGQ